jgi:hypothetical protein
MSFSKKTKQKLTGCNQIFDRVLQGQPIKSVQLYQVFFLIFFNQAEFLINPQN